jgi:hypothetical protein
VCSDEEVCHTLGLVCHTLGLVCACVQIGLDRKVDPLKEACLLL